MSETEKASDSLGELSRSAPGVYPSFPTNPIKLDGSNYLIWSRSCYLTIVSRGLTGYLTGESVQPTTGDDAIRKWISENALVMAYLVNSMTDSIARGYLFLDTAAKIWEAAKETYSQVGNDAQIYELQQKIHETKQRELSLSQYYSKLRSLWHELDFYDDFHPTNPLDAAAFQKRVEKFRVFEFLAGLNMEYDQIRAQILCRVPFPTLEQSYSMIHLEEKRRNTMHQPAVPERSALYTIAGSESRSFSGNEKQIV